jgi:hypothetical protein
MCCGQNRASVKQASTAPPILSTKERERTSATVESQKTEPVASVPLAPAGSVTHFEYRGTTSLIAIGSATGTRYHFSGPGMRNAVDVRDRLSLAMVPHLAEVRNP